MTHEEIFNELKSLGVRDSYQAGVVRRWLEQKCSHFLQNSNYLLRDNNIYTGNDRIYQIVLVEKTPRKEWCWRLGLSKKFPYIAHKQLVTIDQEHEHFLLQLGSPWISSNGIQIKGSLPLI